jgi:predicted nucleic acid-binding protein
VASVSAKVVLTDTSFWYALYEPRDQYHTQALAKADLLDSATLLLPWPVLYETFNHRCAKNTAEAERFQLLLRKPNVLLLPDNPYRQDALDLAFRNLRRRSMALVDIIIRLILDDVDVRKNALLTFNPRDFSDVCRNRRVEII